MRRPHEGGLVGPKLPLRQCHAFSIGTDVDIEGEKRHLIIFNVAVDRRLGANAVAVRVEDIAPGG